MKEYILSLVGAVLISELFLMIMPEGGMKKYTRMAACMVIMMLLISPVRQCSPAKFAASPVEESPVQYSDIIFDVYNALAENKDNMNGG